MVGGLPSEEQPTMHYYFVVVDDAVSVAVDADSPGCTLHNIGLAPSLNAHLWGCSAAAEPTYILHRTGRRDILWTPGQ